RARRRVRPLSELRQRLSRPSAERRERAARTCAHVHRPSRRNRDRHHGYSARKIARPHGPLEVLALARRVGRFENRDYFRSHNDSRDGVARDTALSDTADEPKAEDGDDVKVAILAGNIERIAVFE